MRVVAGTEARPTGFSESNLVKEGGSTSARACLPPGVTFELQSPGITEPMAFGNGQCHDA